MIYLCTSFLCSTFFFFNFFYFFALFSFLIYLFPITHTYTFIKVKSKFFFNNAFILLWQYLTLFTLMLILLSLTKTTILGIWSNHFLISSYSIKTFLLVFVVALVVFLILSSSLYLSSKEVFDFFLTIVNFHLWVTVLFFTNSLFTLFFVIEVLTALIFLLLVVSTFSTAFFYNNTNLAYYNFIQTALPASLFQSIIFYFWISLFSSLFLYLFLLLFYTKFYSFDWFLLEYIFTNTITVGATSQLFKTSIVWFFLISALFIKIGLLPFFIWKPVFFKNLSYYFLLWYITFYYLFLFLFINQLLTNLLSYFFFYFVFLLLVLLSLSIFFLATIVLETYYIKSFLAISSIINSTYVFLVMISSEYTDLLFWL